jgi:DNA-binding CsgD family transcriptional regulator
VQAHFARALDLVERLGNPPLWATHLRWAGIQQGILLSRPDVLTPHAHALVAASPHSHVAATMAKAGRVWTSVLAGSVDVEAVESAAHGLAAIGLTWDAARLAGHGAGRTDDRKISARLLACARELHPADGARKTAAEAEDDATVNGSTAAPEEVLSERELEVGRLVLQGKTYAEIGQAIFISPRTAEHHIAHIRRRLGATSRSDVIAKLRLLIDESARSEEVTHARSRDADGPP